MDKKYKVQVKDLHKSYGSNEVLKGIDLNVKPSSFVRSLITMLIG